MKVNKLIQLRPIRDINLFHSKPWKRISHIPKGSFLSMCFARAPTMESAAGTGSSPNKPSLAEEMRQTLITANQQLSLSFVISSFFSYQFNSLNTDQNGQNCKTFFYTFKNHWDILPFHCLQLTFVLFQFAKYSFFKNVVLSRWLNSNQFAHELFLY